MAASGISEDVTAVNDLMLMDDMFLDRNEEELEKKKEKMKVSERENLLTGKGE